MRRSILIVFSLLMIAAAGQAQETELPRGLGYFFVAPGGSVPKGSGTLHVGFGGEGRVYKGLGFGADIGGFLQSSSCSCGLAMFSANGSYHFSSVVRDRKVFPFLTAGYTGVANSVGGENWFNFGGGVDYWPRERVGLRVEFRDHVDPNHREPLHFLEARIGLIFK